MLFYISDSNFEVKTNRELYKQYRLAFKMLRIVDGVIEQGSTHVLGNNAWGQRAKIEQTLCRMETELLQRGKNPDLITIN